MYWIFSRLLRLGVRNGAVAAEVGKLMAHREELEGDGELGNMWRCTAVAPLVHHLPDSPFTEQDVLHAIGLLQTNTVSIGVPGHSQGLGLFPTFSLLSHSCTANARYQVLPDRGMVLRAQVDILKGEEVTIHYMTPMLGTAVRRSKIRKNWFFDCTCPRCRDPTEMGTFASALLCPDCAKAGKEGVLLPADPLDPACPSTCSVSGCKSREEAARVSAMVAKFEVDLETEGECVEALETFLVTLGQTLHPQHYLTMTGKRRLLASLHLAMSQGGGGPPSRLLLQQIVDLADESLRVFGVLDPGPTVLKGRMLQYRFIIDRLSFLFI